MDMKKWQLQQEEDEWLRKRRETLVFCILMCVHGCMKRLQFLCLFQIYHQK